jgi:hypothetical protein
MKTYYNTEDLAQFGVALPSLDVMQANIDRCCNLSCRHCHVEAGPNRTGLMNRDTMEACLSAFKGRGSVRLRLQFGTGFEIKRVRQDSGCPPLEERRIVFGNHCYACIAGAGSSCGGATS